MYELYDLNGRLRRRKRIIINKTNKRLKDLKITVKVMTNTNTILVSFIFLSLKNLRKAKPIGGLLVTFIGGGGYFLHKVTRRVSLSLTFK